MRDEILKEICILKYTGFAWVICTKKRQCLLLLIPWLYSLTERRPYVYLKVILSWKNNNKTYCVYTVQCYKWDGLCDHLTIENLLHIYFYEFKALTTLKNDIYCLFGEVVVWLKSLFLYLGLSLFLVIMPIPHNQSFCCWLEGIVEVLLNTEIHIFWLE